MYKSATLKCEPTVFACLHHSSFCQSFVSSLLLTRQLWRALKAIEERISNVIGMYNHAIYLLSAQHQQSSWIKQRQKWMNQHHLSHVIQQTQTNEAAERNPDINSDILNEMTHEISMKLQKKMSRLHMPNQKRVFHCDTFDQPDHNRVADLMENQLNFNCAVCLEMMEPPAKEPVLLIPCSHSFCKQCIFRMIKKQCPDKLLVNKLVHLPPNSHKKCPFCRVRIKSLVGNIQMRQLIEKMITLKEEESVKIKNDFENQAVDYRDKELLKFRKTVLAKELRQCKRERVKLDEALNSYQLIVDHLRNEEIDTMRRYNAVRRELEFIERELSLKAEAMDNVKTDRNKTTKKCQILENSLDKLQAELDKSEVLEHEP